MKPLGVDKIQLEKYDVVVIGAGIGGLCSGALLSHWGYKTLVVEKLSRIGGRCSTEEYEGFKLPTGAFSIHKGAGMGETFQEVGVELELAMVPRLFYRLRGKDYEMPPKGSIAVLLDILDKLEIERAKLLGGLAKAVATEKIMGALRKGISEPEKETMTFRDWLLQYTDNELAHEIFDVIATTMVAGHSYELPASAIFAFFVKMAGFREVGMPPHGNVAEMEKLAKVIRANGDVWTDCPAIRIVVQGGRAKAVVFQKEGSKVEIFCQAVISDIDPKKVVEMAGEEKFDEGYLRTLRLGIRPKPVTLCFVASDRPLWPEDGSPAILMLTGTRRITTMIPLSSAVPETAPSGQHLLFAFGCARSSAVHIDKEEEIRQVTLDLKEQLPLFEKHGRILKIDPRDIDDDFPEVRGRYDFRTPTETPIKNLYNVGDAVIPFGLVGTTAVVHTARQVAETVRKSLK